jgi:UDP-N-acetylmuramoyl-tripeptide--D-alanyl-D-alanine ligase
MQAISTEEIHRCFLQSSGVCTDTRKITEKSLFVALKGDNFDGNTFVKQAIESGASYAITSVSEYANQQNIFYVNDTLHALQALANYHRKQFNIPLIGITGSNGKTTTKELFYAVLSQKYHTLATKGNLNNHIGVPLTLLQLNSTHELAIIEMGANHQGEIALLSKIAEPTIGLITNIGKAHLEGFGGIEGVIKGKTELYRFLEANQGLIIYNADNEMLKVQVSNHQTLTYGFHDQADCKGEILEDTPFLKLAYKFQHEAVEYVQSNLIGKYNAENILSAICIGKHLKVDDDAISRGIAAYVPDNSRSQIIKAGKNTIILDAYNANPSSMKAALDNFMKMPNSSKMVILGDMFELGETSAIEHQNIIAEALKGNYLSCIFIGPRFGAHKQPNALFFDTTQSCAAYLKELNQQQLSILIKGSRGMKLETLLTCFETIA